MSRRAILVLAVAISLYAVYDFWRGYHETRDITGGIVAAALGVIGWAYYGWLLLMKSDSK